MSAKSRLGRVVGHGDRRRFTHRAPRQKAGCRDTDSGKEGPVGNDNGIEFGSARCAVGTGGAAEVIPASRAERLNPAINRNGPDRFRSLRCHRARTEDRSRNLHERATVLVLSKKRSRKGVRKNCLTVFTDNVDGTAATRTGPLRPGQCKEHPDSAVPRRPDARLVRACRPRCQSRRRRRSLCCGRGPADAGVCSSPPARTPSGGSPAHAPA